MEFTHLKRAVCSLIHTSFLETFSPRVIFFSTTFLCAILLSFSFPSFAVSGTLAKPFYSFESASMGTRFRLTVSAKSKSEAEGYFNACNELLSQLEGKWSPWIEQSDVWRINQTNSGKLTVAADTYDVIQRSLQISELTHGAFDITFASVGHLYGYREHIKPSDEDRIKNISKISYRNLRLEPNSNLSILKEGVRIDLGGIAKGESIARLKALLTSKGVRSAYLSLGGDSYLLGTKGKYPWMLGIKHPRKENQVIARIPLQDVAVSTSGDYERFFMDDGQRVHHILSPVSGLPADEVMSVTIIGPEPWKTDALSTSVFVMGVQQGIQLIEQIPDYDVIVVDTNGHISASKGLVSPSDPK